MTPTSHGRGLAKWAVGIVSSTANAREELGKMARPTIAEISDPNFNFELHQARECLFEAGGVESDIGPRDDTNWYWRRAAKMWRDKYESLEREMKRQGEYHH